MTAPQPETKRTPLPDGRGSKAFYGFAQVIVNLLVPLVAKLETEGIENIPRTGPVILVVNHIAWLDVPLTAARVPRQFHDMAKIELFEVPVLGGIMRLLGAFAVRRGEGDRESLRIAERVLADGELLCIFPEGHRSGNGQLSKAHPGAALIALRSGAPIIPVAVTGTEHSLKGFRYGPFAPHVHIRYGKPFSLAQATTGRRTREALERATEEMMLHIAALLPPEYRGAWDPARLTTPPPIPANEIEEAARQAEMP